MKKFALVINLILLVNYLFSQPLAAFTLYTNSANFCSFDTIYFTNNSLNYTSAHWFFGDGTDTWYDNPYHIYTDTGVFIVKLIVIDDNGQKDSASVDLHIYPKPYVQIIQDPTNSTLIARTDADSVFWYYNFEPTLETDTVIYYFDEGIYSVIAKNTDWCTASDTIEITFNSSGSSSTSDSLAIIVKNNILTPEIQDGVNDVLYIEGLAYYKSPCRVYIYNKNGRLVYSNENYTNLGGFNGTDNNGKPLPAGTYFYIIKSEGRKTATGYIDLIR